MYLVNKFGRVVLIDDEELVAKKIKQGFRRATDTEVATHYAAKEVSSMDGDTVFYQTVRATPDGYGMSRDHIKNELDKIDIHMNEQYAGQKVGFLYNYPYSIMSMRTDVRLIYTMFESDKLPEEWPEYLQMADEVIVPSMFCRDTFARAGIQATVVPLGYNQDAYTYIDRKLPSESGAPFTFIHYDSFNLRKGFMEVFNAFTKEFKKSENVKLILKTVKEHPPLPLMKSFFPNIEVVTGTFDQAELKELLGSAHCMVYPSRGEGFGCTPLEAMATGLPAIVPNEHGISEYFNSKYMLEVKAPERCPGLYNRFRGVDVGEMVVCDVDDLRKQMRYAFEHENEMRELGRAASEYVKRYTYQQTAAQLATIIKGWEDREVLKRKDSKYLRVEQI